MPERKGRVTNQAPEKIKNPRTVRAVAVIIAGIVVYAALICYHIAPYDYNLSSLMRVGASNPFFTPRVLEPGIVVFDDAQSGGDGYDGQFYYYTIKRLFMGEKGRANPFRLQRILYPLLSYAFALGQARWLPVSMLLVNLLAIAFSALFLWKLIRDSALEPEYLLLYTLNIGFLIAVFYDVATPLCIGLTVAAAYCFDRQKLWLASAMLALSLLAQETGSLVLAGFGGWLVLRKNWRGVFTLAAAIVPWAIWQAVLWHRYGSFPMLMSGNHFRPPFVGMVSQIASINLPGGWIANMRELSVYPFMALVIALLIVTALELRKKPTAFMLVLLVHALAGICFNKEQIWSSTITSSARTLASVFPFIVICYVRERSTGLRLLIIMSALLALMGIARILLMPSHPFYIT